MLRYWVEPGAGVADGNVEAVSSGTDLFGAQRHQCRIGGTFENPHVVVLGADVR
jgi:hypothetical protein